jgi:hypothetical protein
MQQSSKLSYVIIQDKIFKPNQTCDLIFKKILKQYNFF